MDMVSFSRIGLAFLFVLGLIGLAAWAARKLGLEQRLMGKKRSAGRLGIEETFHLDPRRKLVLLRRDEMLHLVLMSQQGDVLIESHIPRHLSTSEAKREEV